MKISHKHIIPTHRLIIYLIILAVFPLVITGSLLIKNYNKWKNVSENIAEVMYLSTVKSQKQGINNLIRKKYCRSDPLYLEKRLQTFAPLEKERQALEKLTKSQSYTATDEIEKRLAFLSNSNQHINFIVKEVQTAKSMHESLEEMAHSHEIDLEDLRALLEIIEQEHIAKPQLLIRNFQITRKSKSSGNEVFDLYLTLLKREYE